MFDDKTSRSERWKHDRLAFLGEFFVQMNEKNAQCGNSSELLATDETLYAHRGTIEFKQYNPSKSAKYSLL